MRKWLGVVGVVAALSSGLVLAQIDLSDFDDDSMRDMDDANKDLGPVLGAGNAEIALADLEVLRKTLLQTQDYFEKKGGTDDAVKIARDALALVSTAEAQIGERNFEGAAATARDISKNCKSCHDLYKPLTK